MSKLDEVLDNVVRASLRSDCLIEDARSELAALRARLALADDLRVCGARWLAAHADATVLDNSGDYRESGKAFERALKRFSGSEELTDPACSVMSCDLSVVFACGICSSALCETHRCLDKRCVEILALRSRVAALEKAVEAADAMADDIANELHTRDAHESMCAKVLRFGDEKCDCEMSERSRLLAAYRAAREACQ